MQIMGTRLPHGERAMQRPVSLQIPTEQPCVQEVDHADRTWYQVRVQCAYVQTRAHPGTPMDITTLRDTEAVPIVLDQPCGNWYEVQMMQIREPDTLCVPVCTICSVISSGGSVHYSYCTSII